MAIQSDGKIVVAGYTRHVSGVNGFALSRYNPNGSLDLSFGGMGTGKVVTLIGSSSSQANSLAIQSDGFIVVAGTSSFGGMDFAVLRYTPSGSLDTSFGASGIVITPVGAGNDLANDVALQSDGKLVVAGFSYVGSDTDFALVRYNSDGSLDTSFDGDGKVIKPIGVSSDQAYSVAIQSNGKIVAAGYGVDGNDPVLSNNYDFALTRYNSDGSLDTSFDGDGKITTPVGAGADVVTALALQSDGKIVAAGYSVVSSSFDFALTRYNSDGSLDT